jgi:hypothetical protein
MCKRCSAPVVLRIGLIPPGDQFASCLLLSEPYPNLIRTLSEKKGEHRLEKAEGRPKKAETRMEKTGTMLSIRKN